MFLAFEKVFPAGATECDLMMLYRPRPGLPFTAFPIAGEGKRLMWTTFTAEQVDIDVEHPASEAYLGSILDRLAANGVRMARLDAVGYAIKRAGTRSFMTEETLAFIDRLAAQANRRGIEVLVEIHSHYRTQIDNARRVDWIYDFALPPLMLHALFRGTARYLKEWISIRPNNAVTVLDTHDGIGVIDVGADDVDRERHPGLLPPPEIAHLVERIHTNSGGESLRATGTAASNVDLYQVNCTYFDALGRDERAYLAARAVQFFLPGIPQVYYVGLLGGVNDMALLERTGVGRDINRHHYATGEVENALQAPVVRSLVDLIRFRNSHPAFSGTMRLQESPDHVLRICWETANTHALLEVDLEQRTHNISASGMPTMQGILS
jgi:sucrose phosphorylase